MRKIFVTKVVALILISSSLLCSGFAPSRNFALQNKKHSSSSSSSPWMLTTGCRFRMSMSNDDDMDSPLSDEELKAKARLEEKMAGWENMPEPESKGGIDGFDVGLWVLFPLIVGTSVFFGAFPFFMDKIDVSSVGPPPTV